MTVRLRWSFLAALLLALSACGGAASSTTGRDAALAVPPTLLPASDAAEPAAMTGNAAVPATATATTAPEPVPAATGTLESEEEMATGQSYAGDVPAPPFPTGLE
ncbi:MAG: hypothetical protein ACRDIB_06590, partial [Ardenticatenaceae bacterium]